MACSRYWQSLLCLAALLACTSVRAADNAGQELLDKATETKLSAENVTDLNEVITLCEQALEKGLDDGSKSFANELLASTLTQRAELVCMDLFERPVTPGRARKLVQMALADLQQTLQLDPEQAQPQFLIGRLYAHLGDAEKGLKALDNAVRLSADDAPTRAKALMIRANLKTDLAERKADFDEAAKLAPKDPEVLRFRGMFQLSQNHVQDALADFDAALLLEPNDSDTHEARGIALSLMQKYDEAMEAYNKAIEISPEAAAAYTHRARLRAIKGDAQAALADVEHALRIQPGSVQALQLHAALLGSAGKIDQALADLNLLRTAMPDNPEVLLQIAMLYQTGKRPQKAVAVYDTLLETDPGNVSAYRGRADAELSLGKQDDAIADYEKALTFDAKDSGVLNNLAWVLCTSPEDNLRNGKRAIELAKQACEVTGYKQAHILSTLAAAYAETGDFDTAIEWSKKSVELGSKQLKGQLTKELESYQAQKPWREASPPPDAVPDDAAQADAAAPDADDTARAKPEN